MTDGESSAPATPELGIPEKAIFYLGEVSRGREPQANRRWALLEDGTVLSSTNDPAIDWKTIDQAPFNSAWTSGKYGLVPEGNRGEFLARLSTLGFFTIVAPVPAPAGLKVRGGTTTYVFVRVGERHRLVEFLPGAAEGGEIRRAWGDLLVPVR